ncbi:MAG: formylmethanofuran dehydrogenase [Anaerolineales bacterium]|nr:formylmethanofuran dehydrogenase [Anaerolineae bacterium]PWB49837.1 MAG: formylmethanofuran dehydrogenase [Anaerolineales bacterium]
MLSDLTTLLRTSAAEHSHLCPRQVLGVRMGLAGLARLCLSAPVNSKTALIIIETAGCFADGLRAATGATVGHRTLRVEDMGKIAATFTAIRHGTSLRLAPQADIRSKALAYAPEEKRRYFAQLMGYQHMPDEELFTFQEVQLRTPAEKIISHQNARARCAKCGEEILNEREVELDGLVVCRTCAYGGYYQVK